MSPCIPSPFSSLHSSTSQSLSHLSEESCFVEQRLIWPFFPWVKYVFFPYWDNNDMPTSSRRLLSWLDVILGFSFTKERMIQFSCLRSSPVHYFFFRMYQIIDLATNNDSTMLCFFFFGCLMLAFFPLTELLHQISGSGERLAKCKCSTLKSTPDFYHFVME